MTFHVHSNDRLDAVTVHKHTSCPFRLFDHHTSLGHFCCHPKTASKLGLCNDELPKTCPMIRVPIHIKLSKTLQEKGDALNNDVGLDDGSDTSTGPIEGPTSI